MDSIQTNSPVAARAHEFVQEAKRKKEQQQQQAATKTENEVPANQVSFSQEAQIRLNAEKTLDTKRAEELRIAAQISASEQHTQAINQEIKKSREAKTEDRQLRLDRDSAARAKTETTVKAAKQNAKESDAAAYAAQQLTAASVDKAAEADAKAAKEFTDRISAAINTRTINEHSKAASDGAQKAALATDKKNDEAQRLNQAEADQVRASRVSTETANAKATKLLNMYANVSKVK